MTRRRLPRSFFARPTLTVARDLIGMVLVHRAPDGLAAGRIVEVEAYIGEDDPACHAAPGPTTRNAPLYGPPGVAYVYLNYGLHCLMNVVTERRGFPAAVLIRALEPLDGLALMQRRRVANGAPPHRVTAETICQGPGNLTVAMGITLAQNRHRPDRRRRCISRTGACRRLRLPWTPRIGIRVGTEHEWRAVDARSARDYSDSTGLRRAIYPQITPMTQIPFWVESSRIFGMTEPDTRPARGEAARREVVEPLAMSRDQLSGDSSPRLHHLPLAGRERGRRWSAPSLTICAICVICGLTSQVFTRRSVRYAGLRSPCASRDQFFCTSPQPASIKRGDR